MSYMNHNDAEIHNSREYWAEQAKSLPEGYLTDPKDFEVSGGIIHRVFEGGELSYYFQPRDKAVGGLAVKQSIPRSPKAPQ